MSDIEFIRSVFNKFDIEGVMHFAAFTSVGDSVKYPAKYFKNNYKNTLNLLKVMGENNVNKFIFSSTAAVYGIPKNIPIKEEHELNPINPYGKSKLMVELALEKESQSSSKILSILLSGILMLLVQILNVKLVKIIIPKLILFLLF